MDSGTTIHAARLSSYLRHHMPLLEIVNGFEFRQGVVAYAMYRVGEAAAGCRDEESGVNITSRVPLLDDASAHEQLGIGFSYPKRIDQDIIQQIRAMIFMIGIGVATSTHHFHVMLPIVAAMNNGARRQADQSGSLKHSTSP